MPRARPGPLRSSRGGMQRLRDGSQCVDGCGRLGLRVPALLECVRCPGVGGADSKAGIVAQRCHSALGLAQGQAPWRHPNNDTASEQRTVHHQGQYRQERHAHLPRAGREVLRADANQYIERGTVVLHRGRSPRGRVAALKAVALGPAAWSTGSHTSGPPRRSRVDESAPLGRYRTVPGARMKLYASRLIQTVDLRPIRGRGWAPSL